MIRRPPRSTLFPTRRSSDLGRMVGIRYPMEVNLVGDSKETLRALLPKLERKEDRSWREEIEDGVRKWWELIEDRKSTRLNSSHMSISYAVFCLKKKKKKKK